MYKRVVVPLDGSPVAEAILPFILDIAGPLGLEVLLLHVVQWRPSPATERGHAPMDDLPTLTAKAKSYLAGFAPRLRARGVNAETSVRSGDPVQEILAGAAEAGADLIAMSTHGRTGLGRLLFGSVAEAVLRRAEVPVFLMRLGEAPGRPGGARPDPTPNRI
jgi:nucleotide-binding universal stress UspA family protein